MLIKPDVISIIIICLINANKKTTKFISKGKIVLNCEIINTKTKMSMEPVAQYLYMLSNKDNKKSSICYNTKTGAIEFEYSHKSDLKKLYRFIEESGTLLSSSSKNRVTLIHQNGFANEPLNWFEDECLPILFDKGIQKAAIICYGKTNTPSMPQYENKVRVFNNRLEMEEWLTH